jgi:hypothetical protein
MFAEVTSGLGTLLRRQGELRLAQYADGFIRTQP